MSSTHLQARYITVLFVFSLIALVAACGNNTSAQPTSANADAKTGVRTVSIADAAETFTNQPDRLVVLDVRTPEEFTAGHLAGATLIDFYDADFEARIAELDRDAPYLLYCRSGNRSGQTANVMRDLGFTDVSDVDGGINAWLSADHPLE